MYQRGSIRQIKKRAGLTWIIRYRVTRPDGKRVEHNQVIGLVKNFPKDADALREVDRLGVLVRINEEMPDARVRFKALAEHYLQSDFGEDAVRPKSSTTIPIVEHYVRDYVVRRWSNEIADDITPLAVQRWLKSLNTEKKLAWSTVSKIRGIMARIYRIGLIHGLVTKNPVEHVETRSKTNYKAILVTPGQTLTILESLPNPLHYALVLTCAATALRASEILSLRWSDILWAEERIRISKRWAKGEDGETKTEASDAYVPLHPVLAERLQYWHLRSPHSQPEDFVFPSIRENGRIPLYASTFVADYLRPAAIDAGVPVAKGKRFGLHNFRHSLSTFLVNSKIQARTVQGLLRHANVKTTLNLYTQADGDETRAAQGQFLTAVGLTQRVQ